MKPALPPDIAAFFGRYRDAFNRLDGRAVAAMYAEPAGIAQDARYTHWATRGEVESNMTALCTLYREKGFVQALFEAGWFLDQGPNHAIVDLHWRIDWQPGQAPWHFTTTYNLIRAGEGWQVLLCTAYSEAELHKKGSDPAWPSWPVRP